MTKWTNTAQKGRDAGDDKPWSCNILHWKAVAVIAFGHLVDRPVAVRSDRRTPSSQSRVSASGRPEPTPRSKRRICGTDIGGQQSRQRNRSAHSNRQWRSSAPHASPRSRSGSTRGPAAWIGLRLSPRPRTDSPVPRTLSLAGSAPAAVAPRVGALATNCHCNLWFSLRF